MLNKKLSFKQYFFYGIGALGNGWAISILGFFILEFYRLMKISIVYYLVVQIIVQFFNAVNDPIIGAITDRTNSKWGRRRPFILVSAFIFPIFFALNFSPFTFPFEWLKYLCFFLFLNLFYISQSIFNIPHVALIAELSDYETERNKLAASANFFMTMGFFLGPSFATFLLTRFLNASQVKLGYVIISMVSVAVIFMSSILTFLFTKERNIPLDYISLKQRFNMSVSVLKYRSYVVYTVNYLSISIAIQVVHYNILPYIIHTLERPDLQLPSILISTGMIPLLVIFNYFLTNKIGKKTSLYIGDIIFMIGCILMIFPYKDTKNIYAYMIISAFCIAYGIASGYYITSAMIPDIITEDYISTGYNREGTISSVTAFIQKLSIGVAHSITSIVLAIMGYDVELETQTPLVKTAFRAIIVAVPALFLVISLVSTYFYPLDEKTIKENEAEFESIMKNKSKV